PEARARKNGLTVSYRLTRSQPSGWKGYARRIDDAMLKEVSKPLGRNALAFICGPTALVELAADGLERVGLPADRIRTERFGPSGACPSPSTNPSCMATRSPEPSRR